MRTAEYKNKARQVWWLLTMSPGWMMAAVALAVLSSVFFFVPYLAAGILLQEQLAGNGSFDRMLFWGIAAFVGAAVFVIGYFASLSCSHMASFQAETKLKMQAIDHLGKLPMGRVQAMGQGETLALLEGGIKEIQSFLAHAVPEIVQAILMPLILFGLMFAVDYRYAIAVCVVLAVVYRFQMLSNGPGGATDMMKVYLDALADLHHDSVEYVRGIREIRLYGEGKVQAEKLHHTIRRYTQVCIPYNLIWEKYRCIFSGMLHNLYLAVLPVGAVLLKAGDRKERLAIFLYYLLLTLSAKTLVPKLEGIGFTLLRVLEQVQRLESFLQEKELTEVTCGQRPENCRVEFQNVSFSYTEDKQALHQVSFVAEPGTLTALVGHSGSGKSTLLKLLLRFWEPKEGKITIGGVELKYMSWEELANQVVCVFQEPYLFHATVAENIRGGKKQADMEKIISAAQMAGCEEFIQKLPQGYETVLGEGIRLSGGEKQRLSIARAILQDAPIVLLDEVTSASDPENERKIQRAVDALIQHKTVFVAAHRLPSIKRADQILVLEQGRIAEQGKHEDLLNMQGIYAGMWTSYARIMNWKVKEGVHHEQ